MSFLWPIFNDAIFDWQNTLEDLPQKTFFHCLVTLGNRDLFYSGGQDSPLGIHGDSYRYSMQHDRWDQMANMLGVRGKHGCGRVTNSTTGKEEVVVAGGTMAMAGYHYLSTSEIYTVEDNAWRQGPLLPTALRGPASLPYEDSFLIVGGRQATTCLTSIYKV